MRKVMISDITMKQAVEAGGYLLSFREKIELAKLLDRLGASVVELGPVESPKSDRLLIKSVASAVKDAVVRNQCVYFAAVGGAGALLSKSILESEVIAYDDLGTEAIRRLKVENFPVIVVLDAEGNDLYQTAIEAYRESDGL